MPLLIIIGCVLGGGHVVLDGREWFCILLSLLDFLFDVVDHLDCCLALSLFIPNYAYVRVIIRLVVNNLQRPIAGALIILRHVQGTCCTA